MNRRGFLGSLAAIGAVIRVGPSKDIKTVEEVRESLTLPPLEESPVFVAKRDAANLGWIASGAFIGDLEMYRDPLTIRPKEE